VIADYGNLCEPGETGGSAFLANSGQIPLGYTRTKLNTARRSR